jgi:hypothetical protein
VVGPGDGAGGDAVDFGAVEHLFHCVAAADLAHAIAAVDD